MRADALTVLLRSARRQTARPPIQCTARDAAELVGVVVVLIALFEQAAVKEVAIAARLAARARR